MEAYHSKRGLCVAGVLSGTSADGIDVALVRFVEGALGHEMQAFETLEFPGDLKGRVDGVLAGESLDLGALSRLDRDLGLAFGGAAREVADGGGHHLDLVGSHGQTLWHYDGVGEPATLQVGDGNHVATAAGVPCVSDFRQADVAVGGGGAPLSLHGDLRIFGQMAKPLAILNLGGIANLSILPGEDKEPLAFDTGPAGALLDGLARRVLNAPMDRDGAAARGGKARPEWVEAWMEHPFFGQAPPKSTGRDTFGSAYLDHCLRVAGPGATPEDLLASGVCVVARGVAQALERFVPVAPTQLWVAGGGVHNQALMRALAQETGCNTASSAMCGVRPDAREGLLFAFLALDFLLGQSPKWPQVTGARAFPILGKWSYPPRGGRPAGPA